MDNTHGDPKSLRIRRGVYREGKPLFPGSDESSVTFAYSSLSDTMLKKKKNMDAPQSHEFGTLVTIRVRVIFGGVEHVVLVK